MAASRRLLSLLSSRRRQPHIFSRNNSSLHFLPSVYSLLHNRQTRTLSQTSNPTDEEPEASTPESVDNSVTANAEVNFTAKSELKISPRHDLAIMFTCKVCETRSVKTVSRESYDKGVVVARCGGCNNYHLIADHLGIFGDKCNIEDILTARGEEVKKGNSDTLNLTLEDLVGITKS